LAAPGTTSRDELLGMGPVAIGSHLQTCLRNRHNLEQQRDYEVAASDARVKDMEGQISDMAKNLESMKNASARNRAELQGEKAELNREVDALKRNISEARSRYDAQFTEWYNMKAKVSAKLSAAKSCKCAKGAVFGQLQVPDGERDYMYDTAQKVEECESASVALSKEIAEAQARSQKATIRGVQKIDDLKRSASDRQRISALLSAKPQIEALKKTKAALVDTLESWEGKIEGYKTATDSLEKSLKQLDEKLSTCGCAR